jgi:hypothetical protein
MKPQIKEIATPPFCFQCVSFIPKDTSEPEDIERCRRFPMLDLVLGNRFFIPCTAVRGQEAPCGEEGKLFQAKASLFQAKASSSVEPEATGLN